MAPAQSKRRSRKRRQSAAMAAGGVVGQPRRDGRTASRPRSAREALAQGGPPRSAREAAAQGPLSTTLTGRTYGDPPPNPFGGVPVSEVAILTGAIAVVVGLVSAAAPALIAGVVVCTLGVAEFSAREHFSGYRSHSTLLAGIPAVVVGILMIALLGGSLGRGTLLLVVVPVFLLMVWILRRRFRIARQARLVKPPAP